MCAQYIYAPLLTRFAEYLKAGDMRGFLRLVFKVSLAIFALALAFGLLFALVGEPVLVLIFGSSIAPYAYLIVPLVLCTVMTAYVWFLGDVLITMRRNRENLAGYAISFALILVSMYPMIHAFEMNGVSFASCSPMACRYCFSSDACCLTRKGARLHLASRRWGTGVDGCDSGTGFCHAGFA